jgi:hypothetical protein
MVAVRIGLSPPEATNFFQLIKCGSPTGTAMRPGYRRRNIPMELKLAYAAILLPRV